MGFNNREIRDYISIEAGDEHHLSLEDMEQYGSMETGHSPEDILLAIESMQEHGFKYEEIAEMLSVEFY